MAKIDALELAKSLIRCPSVTPEVAGAYEPVRAALEPRGFVSEIDKTPNGTTNLWCRKGAEGPLFVFAGHVDVVPPGDDSLWTTPPFEPEVRDGRLFGRGSSDMKTSDACFAAAAAEFVDEHPDHKGSIALLLTSDEEGDGDEGTVRVAEKLAGEGLRFRWCLVGEPSCSDVLGDTVKVGRRGSLNDTITFKGKQGHVAYPQKCVNPIHGAAKALGALASHVWDEGDDVFPATSFQVSNIHAGVGANNVVPAEAVAKFNLRYAALWKPEDLIREIEGIVEKALVGTGVTAVHDWRIDARPFVTRSRGEGSLAGELAEAIKEVTGNTPSLSTAGGTSDARFLAPMSDETLEFGPTNGTIHSPNENIGADEPEKLKRIYKRLLEKLLLA